jgi:hypothetical protein
MTGGTPLILVGLSCPKKFWKFKVTVWTGRCRVLAPAPSLGEVERRLPVWDWHVVLVSVVGRGRDQSAGPVREFGLGQLLRPRPGRDQVSATTDVRAGTGRPARSVVGENQQRPAGPDPPESIDRVTTAGGDRGPGLRPVRPASLVSRVITRRSPCPASPCPASARRCPSAA